MKPSNDFGYRSLGPGFLAQFYAGNLDSSYVDTRGGDIINYSYRKKHRLDELPEKELIRALFFDSITIIEYAIKDLATLGKLRKTKSGASSAKYTPKLLYGELSWVFDPSDINQIYSFEYCCDVLNLDPEYIRRFMNKRLRDAMLMAREINEGKREIKPMILTRQGGLFCENSSKWKTQKEFFGDLNTL